jgi:hypothetical protein
MSCAAKLPAAPFGLVCFALINSLCGCFWGDSADRSATGLRGGGPASCGGEEWRARWESHCRSG